MTIYAMFLGALYLLVAVHEDAELDLRKIKTFIIYILIRELHLIKEMSTDLLNGYHRAHLFLMILMI